MQALGLPSFFAIFTSNYIFVALGVGCFGEVLHVLFVVYSQNAMHEFLWSSFSSFPFGPLHEVFFFGDIEIKYPEGLIVLQVVLSVFFV